MGEGGVDPRLLAAVGSSRAWYDDVFAMHGRTVRVAGGLWWSPDVPVPWHSGVKTLRPEVPVGAVVAAVGGGSGCGVADSFADLDLEAHGLAVLFEATWVHHPGPRPPRSLPPGWSVVGTPRLLAEWTAAHDYAGVLGDAVLAHPRFHVLAEHRDGRLVGGAVVHDSAPTAGLSNVWAADGHPTDWPAVLDAAAHVLPGRAVVGYEAGPALAVATDAGFAPLGRQRVWA